MIRVPMAKVCSPQTTATCNSVTSTRHWRQAGRSESICLSLQEPQLLISSPAVRSTSQVQAQRRYRHLTITICRTAETGTERSHRAAQSESQELSVQESGYTQQPRALLNTMEQAHRACRT